jgi:predicted nucleotidyltransferase
MRQVRSFGSVKIISLNWNEVIARLREIATRIREQGRVDQVRLFRSLARGDETGASNADALIVLRESSESDPLRRILAFLPYFDLDLGVDLLVYTRVELDRELTAGNRFVQRIWRESIPL